MIPDFFRRENYREPDELTLRFADAIRRYEEHFPDDDLMTEASSMSRKEWIEAIDECIRKNITIWEYLGEEYDPECDY